MATNADVYYAISLIALVIYALVSLRIIDMTRQPHNIAFIYTITPFYFGLWLNFDRPSWANYLLLALLQMFIVTKSALLGDHALPDVILSAVSIVRMWNMRGWHSPTSFGDDLDFDAIWSITFANCVLWLLIGSTGSSLVSQSLTINNLALYPQLPWVVFAAMRISVLHVDHALSRTVVMIVPLIAMYATSMAKYDALDHTIALCITYLARIIVTYVLASM